MAKEKTIWFLWYQGQDNLPEIVQLCYDSWVKKNPDYSVIFIDDNTLSQYIDLPEIDHITPQALSDLIRINLLKKYGGVWVDATCFCVQPLRNWLDNYMRSGFFAFSRPGPDRMISSWLLSAKKGNQLVKIYADAFNAYWQQNNLKKHRFWFQKIMDISGISRLLHKYPYLWHSWFIVKFVKIYPYFCFHYLFEKNYKTNKIFKEIWDQTPKVPTDIPHRPQFYGLNKEPNSTLKDEIENKKAPLYKLTFKISLNKHNPNTVYNMLKRVHKMSHT